MTSFADLLQNCKHNIENHMRCDNNYWGIMSDQVMSVVMDKLLPLVASVVIKGHQFSNDNRGLGLGSYLGFKAYLIGLSKLSSSDLYWTFRENTDLDYVIVHPTPSGLQIIDTYNLGALYFNCVEYGRTYFIPTRLNLISSIQLKKLYQNLNDKYGGLLEREEISLFFVAGRDFRESLTSVAQKLQHAIENV